MPATIDQRPNTKRTMDEFEIVFLKLMNDVRESKKSEPF